MAVKIGTSGWQYRHWRTAFYPEGLPPARWLGFYAGHFDTVEVDSAYYRLPAEDVVDRWRDATPDRFEMAMKASSYLTHTRRLRDPAEPVERLMSRARRLEGKLGPVLLQLPPSMRVEVGRLSDALDCFPSGTRVALEARHESWDCDAVFDVLAAHDAAWCVADAPWRSWPAVRTARWGYLRFHEGAASPRPCYGRPALATWAETVAAVWPGGADVYAYFNNDAHACALRDARRFAAACARAGLETSRVPGPGVVHLGG